jgi:hypothetical protein
MGWVIKQDRKLCRLQAWAVGGVRRTLTSNLTLDDVERAPDDAFEVALINAHTGASLLGGTGLTHNDAFFNLQANGAEHKAAQVSTQRLADGSILVVVDLGGVPVGTVANLSFDLIGFGRGDAAASSRVTVSDLSLGMQLVATDDTAQVDEDGEVDIDVIGNDDGADRAGVEVVLVGVPAHGSVQRKRPPNPTYKSEANSCKSHSLARRSLLQAKPLNSPAVSSAWAVIREYGC